MNTLFKSGIWSVTDYGIECKGQNYFIEATRLGDRVGGAPSWPVHMAEKNWADIENFLLVFRWALANHPKLKRNIFTPAEIDDACFSAMRETEDSRAFDEFLKTKCGDMFCFIDSGSLLNLSRQNSSAQK